VLLIWGYRTRVLQLAMVTFLCGRCGNPSAHALRKAVTKFTLFFIPLFPINIKYTTQCTFCGATNKLTKEQALQAEIQGASQQPAAQQHQPMQQAQPQYQPQFVQQPPQAAQPQFLQQAQPQYQPQFVQQPPQAIQPPQNQNGQ
jgi:zinc-ribbon family